jgi:streptogramin lyase
MTRRPRKAPGGYVVLTSFTSGHAHVKVVSSIPLPASQGGITMSLSGAGVSVAMIVLLAAVGVAEQALAQTISEFPLSSPNSGPYMITMGPDGAVWFNQIGRITTAGVVTNDWSGIWWTATTLQS